MAPSFVMLEAGDGDELGEEAGETEDGGARLPTVEEALAAAILQYASSRSARSPAGSERTHPYCRMPGGWMGDACEWIVDIGWKPGEGDTSPGATRLG